MIFWSLFFSSGSWFGEIILISEAIFELSNLIGKLIALHTEHEQIKFIIGVVLDLETFESSSVHYVGCRSFHSFVAVSSNGFLDFLVLLFSLLNHFLVLLFNFTQFFEKHLALFASSIEMMSQGISVLSNIENWRVESRHLWLNMIE